MKQTSSKFFLTAIGFLAIVGAISAFKNGINPFLQGAIFAGAIITLVLIFKKGKWIRNSRQKKRSKALRKAKKLGLTVITKSTLPRRLEEWPPTQLVVIEGKKQSR